MVVIERLIRFGEILRQRSVHDFLVIGLWLVALAWLELIGRRTASDVADGFLLSCVVFLVACTTLIHVQWKLKSVVALLRFARSLKAWFTAAGLTYGADLRGTPPIPRRWPRRWFWAFVLTASTTVVLSMKLRWFPIGFRELLAGRCYLAYLSSLAILWSALLSAALVHSLFAWGCLHDAIVGTFLGQGRRSLRQELGITCAVVALLAAGACFLPIQVPLGIFLLLFSIYSGACCLLPASLVILWRPQSGGVVRSIDGRAWYWMQGVMPILISAVLVLVSRGETWSGSALRSKMPLTALLGQLFAWCAVAGTTALTWQCLRLVALGIFLHPRHKVRPELPALTSEERDRALRRDEIVHRRRIVRGLEKLFKESRRRSFSQGTGFLIGLQHWFVLGMVRDEDEQNHREDTIWDGIIGPPYYRAFPPEARDHFREMTAALQVDLLFVEDGVPFRRFVRVLKMMFEIYDIFGGRRRIEEWHFTGLPGIRVIIHDFTLDQPLLARDGGYPEPSYEEIGRARIVHVFKDRGESEELEPVPSDSEGQPVLTSV
jgi:hypothetical protein